MFSNSSFSRDARYTLNKIATKGRLRIFFTKGIQLLLGSGGIAFIVWAFIDPRFRDSEGFFIGTVCFPISASVALILLGWGIVGRFREFVFWLVLGLVGQAAALQMIEAGKIVRYQHYKPFVRILAETQPLILIFFFFQIVIVLVAFIRHAKGIRDWLTSRFNVWQILGIGLVFNLFAATVSLQIPRYLSELSFAAFIQSVNLMNIILLVMAFPEEALPNLKERIERLLGNSENEETSRGGSLDRFAGVVALWVIVLSATLNLFSYGRHPHVADEVVYLYHARFLANGTLTTTAPPVPEAFDVYLMQFDGDQWYPSPPPGWPALLAVGELAGAPWLVNPILAGINILLIYVLLNELYSRRVARIAILLLSLSPWFIFMAMNFMTHTFTLTCALCAWLGVIWSRKTGRARWALLGGSFIGILSLIRPLEGLIIALLCGFWAIGIGGKRLKFTSLVGLTLGTAFVGAVVFPYNQALTGDPTIFPINAYTDLRFGPNANAYGFGPDRGMGWPIDPNLGHSPLDGLINANLNIFSTNNELFGWSTGSLLLMTIFLFSRRFHKVDYLMMAVIVAIFGVYFFYYFSGGPDFGARYWYLMLLPLLVLTVRGIQNMEGLFSDKGSPPGLNSARVLLAVLFLSLFAFINYFPWRAIDKYFHYLGMRPDIRYLAQEYDFGKSLVLVKGVGHPDYASVAVYNPLDLQSDVPIYVWDRGPEVSAQIVSAYSDRPVWIVEGPTITGQGYQVVDGPLTTSVYLSENSISK